MKKIITLLLLLLLNCFMINAQSHSTKADDYCKLKGKRGNQLGYCDACYAEDKKIADAKVAQDNREREKLYEDYRIKKEKTEKEREQQRLLEAKESKSGEVSINMSSSTNSSNTTTTKTLDNYDSNTGTYSNPLTTYNSSGTSEFQKNYETGQQLGELTNTVIDIFSKSPEKLAREEQARIEAAKRDQEYRQKQLQLKIENEKNAKEDFNRNFLNGLNHSDEKSRVITVINGMDIYISENYNYDIRDLIPNWKSWMSEAITNNNKFVSVVFSAKALGFCYNKFNYNLDINPQEAVQILEKVANSGEEKVSYLGVSWESVKKTIKVKNKKKKLVSKEINVNKIKFVANGSSASLGGLMVGDEIVMINNEYVDHLMHNKIQNYKVGEKIKVTYTRDGKEYVKEVTLGSTIKDLYNIDAMLILANYYNTKEMGNNPEKALYYFTKAAENKSPTAMYALGQIYQNNVFGNKKVNVKFKFKNNDAFAHEWYTKSLQDLYYTNSQIKRFYHIGTDFEPKSFDELITMYKKGIGCKKDLLLAEEILKQKTAYLERVNKK